MSNAQGRWPDKDTMCHRTGFTKSCHECVKDHGCRLWKEVTLEHHPETGAPGVKLWDCLDSLQDLYMKDMLRRQVQTTGSVDHLRKEVAQSNDVGMGSVLAGLNSQIQRLSRPSDVATIASSVEPQKLIGTN